MIEGRCSTAAFQDRYSMAVVQRPLFKGRFSEAAVQSPAVIKAVSCDNGGYNFGQLVITVVVLGGSTVLLLVLWQFSFNSVT